MAKTAKILAASALLAMAMAAPVLAEAVNDPLNAAYQETFVDPDTGLSVILQGTKISIDAYVASGAYREYTNPEQWLAKNQNEVLEDAVQQPDPEAEETVPARERTRAERGSHPMDQIRFGAGDFADGITTGYGLTQPGIHEANPLLASFGAATPLAAMGMKYGLKLLFVESGLSPAQANYQVETVGWAAGCMNLVTLAGVAAPPALLFGAACYAIAQDLIRAEYEASTGRGLNGLMLPLAEWQAAIDHYEG